MATGIALNSAAAIQFLKSCDAVTSYTEHTDDWLSFSYDPKVDVSDVPDYLVWFSIDAAPVEAQSVLSVGLSEGSVIYIHSRKDLKTYVDSALGSDATAQDIEAVTDVLQFREHPAYGDNWGRGWLISTCGS